MPVDGEATDVTAALHALLAESVVLWGAGHHLRPWHPSSAIVLCDGTGVPFVTIEPLRPPTEMGRWSVIVANGHSGTRRQVCSSVLGVLQTVGTALDAPAAQSAAIRFGVSPAAP